MKKLIFLLVILIVTFSCKKGTNNNPDKYKIAIITSADLQSQILPQNEEINSQEISVGGLARIASLAQTISKNSDYSLMISSGDDMIGAFYEFGGGVAEMKGMTLAGYDVATPGNHEFDYGADLYKSALKHADFDFVVSNLTFQDPELGNMFKPYLIISLGTIKVGMFGLMTPEFPYITSAGNAVSVDPDFVSVAQNMVNELKTENCDLIIAVTHIGSDLDVELAQKVEDIDIIVGGHSHDIYYNVVDNNNNKTIIVNDGEKATYMGSLEFTFENNEITQHDWNTILLDSTVGSVKVIQDLMEQYMNAYNDSTNIEIGSTSVDLDGRESTIRFKESNLGDLICDSWLDWFPDVDVSLLNGGGIRGDKIIPPGPISYNNLLEIQPFFNYVYKAKMKGSHLKQVLEISASALHIAGDGCPEGERPGTGGFMQVGGIKFTIDTTQQPFCAKFDGHNVSEIISKGSRVSSVQVFQNNSWIVLDTTAIYTCLVNEWIQSGGDGYYVFLLPDVTITNTTMHDIDLFTAYIKKNSPVSPQVDGRINFQLAIGNRQ